MVIFSDKLILDLTLVSFISCFTVSLLEMSGYVHPPAELLEEFDSTKWNPLQCNICSEQYQEPCILQCYHSFCAGCVRNRVEENGLTCPVCRLVYL